MQNAPEFIDWPGHTDPPELKVSGLSLATDAIASKRRWYWTRQYVVGKVVNLERPPQKVMDVIAGAHLLATGKLLAGRSKSPEETDCMPWPPALKYPNRPQKE